jgi:hypothetical protein
MCWLVTQSRRNRHQEITEEKERLVISLEGNLEDAELEFSTKDKKSEFDEYLRELNELTGTKRRIKRSTMKGRLAGILLELSFSEKKRILEAVFNGTKIKMHPEKWISETLMIFSRSPVTSTMSGPVSSLTDNESE